MTILDTSLPLQIRRGVLCKQAAEPMTSSLAKLRIYFHLVPVFGVLPSLWIIYGERVFKREDSIRKRGVSEDSVSEAEEAQLQSVSRLSVVMGLGCMGAIALLAGAADAQVTQMANLRFLIASSFVGSSYFVLNLVLIVRVAKGHSIRLPGISQLSRRLP
jgi:hypothetical protein